MIFRSFCVAAVASLSLLGCSSEDDPTGAPPANGQDAGDSATDGNAPDSPVQDAKADAKDDAIFSDTFVPDALADAEEPAEPAVHFVGRHESSAPGQARFGWSGAGLVVRFNGTAVRVRMNDPAKYFTVVVDGVEQPTLATTQGSQTYTLVSGLSAGEHVVQMLRQTEGFFGATSVEEVQIDGQLLAPPPVTRRIEVLGDSISCGYGNEGSDQTCSFSAETENHYLAYESIAARELGAELSTIAWSGKGIIYNYGDDTIEPLPALFGRSIPSEDGAWGFNWQPDVVLINLGTNDFSTSDGPSEAQFVGAYSDLLETIRSKYPAALVLCTVAPLLGADEAKLVQGFIDKAVQARASVGDSHIKRIDLSTPNDTWGCDWHPSAATHEAMADLLSDVLKTELGW